MRAEGRGEQAQRGRVAVGDVDAQRSRQLLDRVVDEAEFRPMPSETMIDGMIRLATVDVEQRIAAANFLR